MRKTRKFLSLMMAVLMLLLSVSFGNTQIMAEAATISLNRPLDKDYTITAREYYSGGSYHGALDYGVPKFTPVYAAEDGVINVRDGGYGDGYYGCQDGNTYGNYATISHHDGWVTYYAHMSTGRFVVKSGDSVKRGQLIGYSGNSGNTTGPHLHFELRQNGSKVYVEPYIKTASGYHSTASSPHTCDQGTFMYYWAEHPHYNCYKCSICGEIWASNEKAYVSECSYCNVTIYPTSGATYKIASGVGNNMYLDFSLSTINVQIYEDCDKSDNVDWVKSQYFTLNHVGDGWYTITNIGNGKLVDVALGDPASGTNIQQCAANGNNAQLYRFYDAGDGYCYIKSKLGCYVDVQNGDNFNNANVWVYTFNGTNAQKWKLIKKDVPSLTVNFVHNSSSDCADKNVIHGDAYGNLPEPKRPGFVFEGWYTALNGGTKITSSTKVTATSNHTLYAHWKTQTVYFDVNHSNINVNLFRTINGKIIDGITFNTNSQILSLDGSFGSWTTILDIPFSVNENDWCCITANSLSGKVQDGDCVVFEAVDKDLSSMTYSIGRRIHYDVAHTGNGIYNGAWGIDKSACGIKYIKLMLWSGDGPFYCEDSKLQIKIEKESRTEYSPAAQVITNGNTYGTLPTPTRDGYTFDGWYTSATGGTKITSSSKVTVTGDQTLYAHWTCNHSSTELRNVATATCTSVGYSGDTFCKTCSKKIKNGTEIEKASHTDTNSDKICDVCSEVLGSITPDTPEEPSNNCSCNCHRGGIAGFFFKLINFFEKIFGINKVCACGVKH